MRIVSLLPSATEIVCCLGLADQLVGVTHECDFPADVRSKPKVTRTLIPVDASSAEIDRLVREQRSDDQALYSLDFDAMSKLRPELIVTQTLCDVCAVDDYEVKKFVKGISTTGITPKVLYLEPTTLNDVLDDIGRVASAASVGQRGNAVVLSLRQRIERVRTTAREGLSDRTRGSHRVGQRVSVDYRSPASGGDGRPRVVVLEWLDPLFSCGHWTPQLVEIAGGVEPLVQAGQRSRRIEPAELAAADPDVLMIACCGFNVERTLTDLPRLLEHDEVRRLRCIREGRVFVTDGSAYFSRPGPRLVDAIEILAHALDPSRHELSESVPAAVHVPLPT